MEVRTARVAARQTLGRRFHVMFFAALFALVLSPGALAAVYYVDQNHPQADDSNPGTQAQPWLTLYRAMEEKLQPGDTVLVKKGRYQIERGGGWAQPSLNPASSGEPGKPITIRSVPRHAAELVGQGGVEPLIGVRGRDHIVIDGFVISRGDGVRGVGVFGIGGNRVTGVVIQNNIIHGMYETGVGNSEGIRLERVSGVTVRNNKIYDARNDQMTSNAAGIKLYFSDNVVLENNEIFDVVAGIKEKENGEFVDIRRNLIHSCSFGIEIMNQNDPTTQGYRIYENIIRDCGTSIDTKTNSTAVLKEVYIYNNVLAGYTSSAVNGTRHGQGRRMSNNIFYRAASQPSQGDFFTYNDPPTEILLMDHNLYAYEPQVVIGLYGNDRRFGSLAAWQASGFGFDQNSQVADPRFEDPLNDDFRLAADSPARGAGRDESGATVDIGAYPRDDDAVIGLTWASGALTPAAPQLAAD